MPSKDKTTIGVSSTKEVKEQLSEVAETNGMTISGLAMVLFRGVIDGKIRIKDGEIIIKDRIVEKRVEEHNRYSRRFERFIEKLEEKGYPERVIDGYIDRMMEQVSEIGKYNSRRCYE